MNREAFKRENELKAFLSFVDRIALKIDRNSVRHGDANLKEPDILCARVDGAPIGFELSRLTDPVLARMVNRPEGDEYVRLGGHSIPSLREKLAKTYSFPHVELLLYRENIGTPDNVLIPQVKPFCSLRNNYASIWYMSEKTIKLLYKRGKVVSPRGKPP
jgi:hypothetical protein